MQLLAGALFLTQLACSLAGNEFDAFRMIQYDDDGAEFGSRRARMDFLASSIQGIDSHSRKAILVRLADVSVSIIDSISTRDNVDALLILLPEKLDDVSTGKLGDSWVETERALIQRRLLIPVYFAFEDAALNSIYTQVVGGESTGDGTQVVVVAEEGVKLAQVPLHNIIAKLSSGQPADGSSVPTIALVAHYDTFGVVPDLAVGADSNGSGVVAILELARMFARLYAASAAPKKYDVLFLLTAGGYLNFHGASQWIEAYQGLDAIEFVLCLDGIGARSSDSGLFLHSTKSPKEGAAAKFHSLLESTSKIAGVDLEHVYAKVNGSSTQRRWEHEPFSIKKIPAATLSSHKTSHAHYSEASVLDRRAGVDAEVLKRNIRIAGEALAHLIFELPESTTVFSQSLALNSAFVSAWISTVSSYPRVAPFTSPNITAAFHSALTGFGLVLEQQNFTYDGSLSFYTTTRVRMETHKVKSLVFDLILGAIVAAYLIALNFGLQERVRRSAK